jgi:hypothetical protein
MFSGHPEPGFDQLEDWRFIQGLSDLKAKLVVAPSAAAFASGKHRELRGSSFYAFQ